jgi:predicted transcriptional regulator
MTLQDLVEKLNLNVFYDGSSLDKVVSSGYSGDLLSDVIANCKPESAWITIQVHHNIIAIAVLKEISAIIIAGGKNPLDDTLEKAKEEQVTILGTDFSVFEIAGKMYELDIK